MSIRAQIMAHVRANLAAIAPGNPPPATRAPITLPNYTSTINLIVPGPIGEQDATGGNVILGNWWTNYEIDPTLRHLFSGIDSDSTLTLNLQVVIRGEITDFEATEEALTNDLLVALYADRQQGIGKTVNTGQFNVTNRYLQITGTSVALAFNVTVQFTYLANPLLP